MFLFLLEDADAAEDTADAAEETERFDDHWLLDRPTSPRISWECSQKQFRISRSLIAVGAYLFDNDRAGAVIYNGNIKGEITERIGNRYTYTVFQT